MAAGAALAGGGAGYLAVTSFRQQAREIAEQGVVMSPGRRAGLGLVALGDVIGVPAIWEGATGRRLFTGGPLTPEERGEAVGSGAVQPATVTFAASRTTRAILGRAQAPAAARLGPGPRGYYLGGTGTLPLSPEQVRLRVLANVQASQQARTVSQFGEYARVETQVRDIAAWRARHGYQFDVFTEGPLGGLKPTDLLATVPASSTTRLSSTET